MWKRRFLRFCESFKGVKGVSASFRFLAWGFRKFVQLLLQEIATKFSDDANFGVPANVSLATGIERANNLNFAYANRLRLDVGDHKPRINLVIPALTPGIIFGGYISFFNFASCLISRGYEIRFIVTESMSHTKEQLLPMLTGFPPVLFAVQNSEIVGALSYVDYAPIPVSKHDVFIAYSIFTALLCHKASKELGADKFIFFLQEEEGHFHAHNSFRATIEYVYTLPHIPIFNSEMLENHFRIMKLGVFSGDKNISRYMTFRHSLSTTRLPMLTDIAQRSPKKLLFFGRPEQHAERNLFEIGLVALRTCCTSGLFASGEWEFHAIGAMTEGFSLDLGGGQSLRFLKRRPVDEYAELLYQYDLGLSLMFAPHPSVPNFEMAAAGMPTVTTTFSNRSKADMEAVCPNFIAVSPHIEGVVAGIKEALERVYDYEARVNNAAFDWPRSWDESFSNIWLDEFDQLIAEISPKILENP
jgi:hypothetical protein